MAKALMRIGSLNWADIVSGVDCIWWSVRHQRTQK